MYSIGARANNNKQIVLIVIAGSFLMLVGLLLVLSRTSSVVHAAPANLFIVPGGSGDCSQSNPCDLQTAVSMADDGDALYLAEGTYTNSGGAVISIIKSIALYGGWDAAPAGSIMRDPDIYTSTLDGEGMRRGIYIAARKTVTLEGLIVTNGVVEGYGGGLYVYNNASLTLRDMSFISNVVTYTDDAHGGGAYLEGGTVHVEASTFQGNSAWGTRSSHGGGLSLQEVLTTTVTDSTFQDNDAWHASGLFFIGENIGMIPLTVSGSTFVNNGRGNSSGDAYGGYASAVEISNARGRLERNLFQGNAMINGYGTVGVIFADLLFSRNQILDNIGGNASGLYLRNVSPFTITNNVIAGNHSWRTAVNIVRSGRGQFLHNTYARNTGLYGVQVYEGSVVTLTNTILVSHTVGISVSTGSTATLEATLWGSGLWANGTDWDGDGEIITGAVNIWGQPAFLSPDDGDFRIGPESAAIDAGVDAGVNVDLAGRTRPYGAGYDVGAYEAQTFSLTVTRLGTGTGTVIGAGINCGDDCTETYAEGTQVILTANPASDSTFAGWNGACTNIGRECVVAMTEARSITATFMAEHKVSLPFVVK